VEKPEKYDLLVTTAKSFRWSILAGVFPRLCMTGFTYAQPFLINTLINYIESSDQNVNQNYGYGLIGAYVLVFFGAAVSCSIHEGATH
jgi:ATP-binding cassette subfamily C (CFTR/MRP) protein 1